MAPFKQFLSPKCSFNWTAELEDAFTVSKRCIVDLIKHGLEIFDPCRRTCLRPDWSKSCISYILIQKHCPCLSDLPDCCEDGWKITLAGSRFLSAAEQQYAPIEGEALAVAWGLEQTKYFSQGCNNLLVVTDHKPLVKILGDRSIDEISNSRIFRLKQRTMPWSFTIAHLTGKTNSAADAASRYPSSRVDTDDDVECVMAAAIQSDTDAIISLSWDKIAAATNSDPTMKLLIEAIESGFPDEYHIRPWSLSFLHVSDGVIMYRDRAVIPKSFRMVVLEFLHSAHQGVTSMQSRARSIVFWPGMTQEIQLMRDNCRTYNKNSLSQPRTPATEQIAPSTPFESVFANYFTYGGHHYLVAGDRLSGWVEMFRAPHGTPQAGADGLIASLRSLFSTFGMPEELSSDSGPEFVATKTNDFMTKWGVRQRISSSYFPQSNGRAEVAVKKCKRLLADNTGPTGSLNNDSFMRALLQIRNTPDPVAISPLQRYYLGGNFVMPSPS